MTQTLRLSSRQQRTLAAICDTFAPGSAARGGPDAVLDLVAASPRAADGAQFAQLLTLVGLRGFGRLSPEQREALLRAWADSRVPQRRTVFQVLRKACLHADAVLPTAAGGPPPLRGVSGYPGALGPPSEPAPPVVVPLAVRSDVELVCDVCVVGSGAGGGTAAAVLAHAGLDVVVLEAGPQVEDAELDGDEAQSLRRLYAQGGAAATGDQGIGLLWGSCLGGSTVINYSTSFRTPDDVRAEWADHGLPAFSGEEFTRSLDAVCDRIGVNLDHNRLSRRDEIFARGLEALGWHCERMPRNVIGCDQHGPECGWCGFGCRRGAKQSTLKTWLVDAYRAGARVLVRTRAERVVVRDGEARGVEAHTQDGHRVKVRARAVVVAAGAIQTPALLLRSAIGGSSVGRNLHLHPATGVFGIFTEEVRPWEGTLQAIYSDEHRDLDGEGYGVKYETAPVHPTLFAAFAPWRTAAQYAGLAGALGHAGLVGVLLRDRSAGEVRVGRDGHPVVRYRLSREDAAHVRAGIMGGARILEAAGATRIVSAQSRLVEYSPSPGEHQRFVHDADACGYTPGRTVFMSFHLMGSARMGDSPSQSACSPAGELWDARRVVVCDGSTFPTASGVNPMVTIEAIAHLNASVLAARLG